MNEVHERRRATAAPGTEAGAALYGKLSPGPGAPREQVLAHQRARVCGAVVEIVAKDGYGALTVREIVQLAGVSTHTFYELFDDKDVCFLETYALLARRSAQRVIAAQAGCEHAPAGYEQWQRRLRVAFLAFARDLASERKAARFALVEAFAGGPGARARMRGAMGLYEAMLTNSFAHAPDGAATPPLVVKGIVSGIARVARTRVMAGRGHELPDLVDELVDWTLSLRCPQALALERLRLRTAQPAHGQPSITAPAAAGQRDERERILDATVSLAARDGFAELTGPRIRTTAGISRRTFETYFTDVTDCFAAAVARLTERAMARAMHAGARAPDWPRGVHRAVQELCRLVLADPVYAKLAFVEVLAPGPDGVRSRDATSAAVADALRASAPAQRRPSELSAEASVGAIWGLMHQSVAAGDARRLQQIAPTLSFFALAPAIGAHDALAAIAAEHMRRAGL